MALFVTNDGKKFFAEDEVALIEALHRDSHTHVGTLRKFMEEVSQRAYMQTGLRVSCTSPLSFIRDLKAAGLITEVEEHA